MGKNETKRYVQVSIHLEEKAVEHLREIAECSERSLSAQARLYIDQGLKNDADGQS